MPRVRLMLNSRFDFIMSNNGFIYTQLNFIIKNKSMQFLEVLNTSYYYTICGI